eukprot:SAG31_NODE_6482_length_2001_cov_42.976190_2_plen_80_part_00
MHLALLLVRCSLAVERFGADYRHLIEFISMYVQDVGMLLAAAAKRLIIQKPPWATALSLDMVCLPTRQVLAAGGAQSRP